MQVFIHRPLDKCWIVALNNLMPVTLLQRDALIINETQWGKTMFFTLKKSFLLCLFMPLTYINSADIIAHFDESDAQHLLQKNAPGIGLAANLAISGATAATACGISLAIYAFLIKRSYDAEMARQDEIGTQVQQATNGAIQAQPKESFPSYFKRNLLSFDLSSAADWTCKVGLPVALTAIGLAVQYSPSRKKA